jgi:cholera toxin transcriptional activator
MDVEKSRPFRILEQLSQAPRPFQTANPGGVHWPRVMATTSSNNPSGSGEPKLLRFGVFEVDVAAGELRKSGKRMRLQEQPFQVLLTLLENAGRVVTRDDLRQKIWPVDTFVDFDHSLNTAVNKIRDTLGDSASSPRFVETLARRGYRFIAPVEGVIESRLSAPVEAPVAASAATAIADTAANVKGMEATTAGAAAGPLAEPVAIDDTDPTELHPELHVPIPRRGLVRTLFVLIQVMFLVFYLSALSQLHDVEQVVNGFLSDWKAPLLVGAVLVTGAVGIPLRCYLISAVAFDFRKLGATFKKLFPFVLALDQLWAVAPFLLLPEIGVGLAFAATAALLYVPFSERTLVRLAYRDTD